MTILFWSSPGLTVLIGTVHTATIFLSSHDPLLPHFSYCAKTPFAFGEILDTLIIRVVLCLVISGLIGELLAHIVIFVKVSRIETRAEVIEIRGNRLVSRMRHQGGDSIMWALPVINSATRRPIPKKKIVFKIVLKIVLRSNFDSVTCANY